MALVMCTKDLWRRLGGQPPLPIRSGLESERGRLGIWGAKAVVLPEGRFCIAMNETTYLTLVFPLEPLPGFLALFTGALMTELGHLGVPPPVILEELDAVMARVSFTQHSHRSLLGSLNDVGHHVDWALEGKNGADPHVLIGIQHQLNEMPHVHRDPPYPGEAASLLFSAGGSGWPGGGQPNSLLQRAARRRHAPRRVGAQVAPAPTTAETRSLARSSGAMVFTQG